jgi:effector-binding domain-containing protein
MVDFNIIETNELPYLYAERTSSMHPEEISEKMGTAFKQVWEFMIKNSIEPAGGALSVYYDYSPNTMTFRAGFAINRGDMANAGGDVKADVTPSGKVLHFVHKGSYATLRNDYELMMKYLQESRLEAGVPSWEIYMNDPDTTPEDELLTECYLALV